MMQNHEPAIATLHDEELVSLAKQGSQTAFSELIRRSYPGCFRTAVTILRDPTDAEDEVQNACWKAYEHFGQFQQEARFSTWLTRIVMNQCLMRLRGRRRAPMVQLDQPAPGAEAPTMEPVSSGRSPEEELGRDQVRALLEREIRRIPPLFRDVLVLRDLQQLPMDAVAGQLGISVAAAKSRLLRARGELRTRLEKHCPRSGPAGLMS